MRKDKCLIRLTQGLFTEVDEKDVEWISKNKWYAKRTTAKREDFGTYYAARYESKGGNPRTIYLHREISECPENLEVDHKNGDSLCNKRTNLRNCTRSQNNIYRDERGY